jgi:hypothetical protein
MEEQESTARAPVKNWAQPQLLGEPRSTGRVDDDGRVLGAREAAQTESPLINALADG